MAWIPNSLRRLEGSVVNEAPVSTVASMSRACWPSMLEMRSGHLKVPMGKASTSQFLPPHSTPFGVPVIEVASLDTGSRFRS